MTCENQTTNSSITLCDSNFTIHSFTKDIDDAPIHFDVIKMKDSLFIWIGQQKDQVLKDLSVAMISHFQDRPLSSQIMGSDDNTSVKISSRLAKKLNKQVFLSCNIPINRHRALLLEKQLLVEINVNPIYF